MASSHSRVAVDCYVRPSLFVEPVNDTLETLRSYDEQQVVDDLAVESWPDEVTLTGDAGDEALLEQYERFQTWADLCGVSLEPGFTRRERTTLVSDTPRRILTPPVLCLVIRVDGELLNVAPHYTENTVYTVEDALADIETLSTPRSPELVS